MKRLFLTLTGWLLCLVLAAQAPQYTIEYWFDGQYAAHIEVNNISGTWQTQMETGQLSVGFHTLNLHIQDTSGRWTSPQSFLFYRAGETSSPTDLNYTCWFDQDYTHRNTGSLDGNTILFDVTSLRAGFHTLNVQTGEGSRAALQSFLFYKPAEEVAPSIAKTYTCWFDQDYEHRNSGSLNGSTILLDVTSLRDGFHTLNVQTGEGMDAALQSFLFYKPAAEVTPANAKSYTIWYDRDYSSPVTGTLDGSPILLDVSSLRDGFHTLNVQTGEGMDAALQSFLFYKVPQYDADNVEINYYCWFDENTNNYRSGILEDNQLLLDVSDLEDGYHQISMLLWSGTYSTLIIDTFYKGAAQDVPQAPDVTTAEASNITPYAATLGGSFTNPDNVDILGKGFRWRLSTATNSTIVNLEDGAAFTHNLTGLTPNTHYSYRAFVNTDQGMVYGDWETFKTTCEPVYGTDAKTICDGDLPFTWNGVVFNGEGTQSGTVQTAKGCDSIVTMTLTVVSGYSFPEETAEVCANSAYQWQGHENVQIGVLPVGEYVIWDSLKTVVHGCDSVYKLTLTVKPTSSKTVEQSVCEGNLPFIWNEVEFTEADTKTVNLTAANGCDSVVTMVLTVNSEFQVPDEKTICAGALPYTWNQVVFEEAGTQTATLKTVHNCDSVVTMTLHVNSVYNVTVSRTICDNELPYDWDGVTTFNEAGSETKTYQSIAGCDSVVTMVLVVNPTYTVNDEQTVCASALPYTWNQVVFEEAGTQTVHLTSVHDCDSAVTMTLHVNPTYETTADARTVCADELPYNWDGIATFNVAGTQTVHLTSVHNCDSAVTLTLIVKPIYSYVETAEVCENQTYVWPNHNVQIGQRTVGVYTIWDSLKTANGCDSVYKLTLTVTPQVSLSLTNANQTKESGKAIDNIQVTCSDYAVLTHSDLPAGLTFNENTRILSGTLTTVGNYTVTFTATTSCGSVDQEAHIEITPRTDIDEAITITSDSATGPIIYDGATHGSEFRHYTVTFGGTAVQPVDEEGLTFTLPTGDVLTVTPTFAGVKNVAALNDTANNNVFTYSITNESLYTGPKTLNYGTVKLQPRPITISANNAQKTYDGEPFVLNYNQLQVSNMVAGESLTAGTVTTVSGNAGEYRCTDGQFNGMMALAAEQSGFEVSSAKSNYAPAFDVTMTITPATLTITANNGEKVYDGTDLTEDGFAVEGQISSDIVTATTSGSQRCVGESANTIASYTVTSGGADVSGNYTVTTVPGTLKVTPITEGFARPEDVTVLLAEGTYDTNLTTATTGTATLTPFVTGTTVGNNLAALNPMDTGTYIVVWTLYDECGNAMTTREQTVVVDFAPCNDTLTYAGYKYPYKRIGYQCWFTENLRIPTGDHHVYAEDAANLEKFGYLYSWYTAVGVSPEGNNNATPATHLADNGTPHVQGICPEGWAIPSQADVAALNTAVGTVDMLKDPAPGYWIPGSEGVNPGTGFNARAGGRYNATLTRYEDLLSGFHFWQSEAPTGSVTVLSACVYYYCGTILIAEPNLKNDRKSVRCIRKKAPHTP